MFLSKSLVDTDSDCFLYEFSIRIRTVYMIGMYITTDTKDTGISNMLGNNKSPISYYSIL